MGDAKEKLLKAIRHYQDSLERHTKTGSSDKLLHAIEKLSKLPIRVCHLEETGIGRTVNGLKKIDGKVGENARNLVDTWKSMVKGEDDAEQEQLGKQNERLEECEENEMMDEDPDPESLQICDEDEQNYNKSSYLEHENSSHKKSGNHNQDYQNSNGRHDSKSRSHSKDDRTSKRKHSDDESDSTHGAKKSKVDRERHKRNTSSSHKSLSSSDSESQSDNESDDSSERESSSSQGKSRKSRRNSSASSDRSSSDSEHSSEDDSSSERDTKRNKQKTQYSEKKTKKSHHRDSSASSSDSESRQKNNRSKEKSKCKEKDVSRKHSKSNSESDRDSKEKHKKSKSSSDSKDKYNKGKESSRDSKEKHNRSKENKNDKDSKEKESRSKKDSSSSKSKSRHEDSQYKNKKDSKESEKLKSKSGSDRESKSSNKQEKNKVSNDLLQEKKSSKSYKEKDSSGKSQTDKKRETEPSEDKHSKKHKGSSHSKDSKSKSHSSSSSSRGKDKDSSTEGKKDKDKKERDKNEKSESEKSKKDSSSSNSVKENEKDKSKTQSKAASSSSKPKAPSQKLPIIYGIDSESGASFADVLGMLEAPVFSKNKKKSSAVSQEKSSPEKSYNDKVKVTKSIASTSANTSSSKVTTTEVPKLLKDPGELEPLDINMSSLLPTITPNYRPLGVVLDNNQPKKMWTDDEALSHVITAKHQRTKVYSGNKTFYTKVPSLFELCSRVLQDNIDALEYTGGVPYSILKPIIEKATPDQLFQLEFHNPYLIEDSDELWLLHCQKEFRTHRREEMESWRDMYMRCLDEREAKLKALTANIKQSQDVKLPVRTTKLAYLDTVVKPPRNIAKRQAKNGTAVDIKRPSQTPTERLNQLAKSGEASKVAVPNPGKAAVERSSSHSHSSAHIKPKKAPLMAKTLSLLKSRFGRR